MMSKSPNEPWWYMSADRFIHKAAMTGLRVAQDYGSAIPMDLEEFADVVASPGGPLYSRSVYTEQDRRIKRRDQPHGPGLKDRKRIWIHPFWKGPEGAVAWSHLYMDKEK